MTYHEPTVMWLFMIGHSLGRTEIGFAHAQLSAVHGVWVLGAQRKHVSQITMFGTILKKGDNGTRCGLVGSLAIQKIQVTN